MVGLRYPWDIMGMMMIDGVVLTHQKFGDLAEKHGIVENN
jgi:hypothetical protein